LRDEILAIPKVVLHDHLDAGLRVATIIDIAKKDGIELPHMSHKDLSQWFFQEFSSKNLKRCFRTFDVAGSVMQTKETLERVAYEFVEDHAQQNVIYVEARFCPYFHTSCGLNYDDIIKSVIKGFDRAKEKYTNIETGIIVCGMYHLSDDTNVQIAEICNKYQEVVGFDFAGIDNNGMLSDLQPKCLKFLNENNIPFTAHSGEFSGIANIIDTIEQGATRIGHACNLYNEKDSDLLQKAVSLFMTKKIHVEINVSSSIAMGLTSSSSSHHPFRQLYAMGINCALNTDDRLMLGDWSITDEYTKACNVGGLSVRDVIKMNLNAAQSAFINDDIKENLIKKIKEY
ncbi:hypothetical protein EGW08_022170, partial [Elysia chlorotica]